MTLIMSNERDLSERTDDEEKSSPWRGTCIIFRMPKMYTKRERNGEKEKRKKERKKEDLGRKSRKLNNDWETPRDFQPRLSQNKRRRRFYRFATVPGRGANVISLRRSFLLAADYWPMLTPSWKSGSSSCKIHRGSVDGQLGGRCQCSSSDFSGGRGARPGRGIRLHTKRHVRPGERENAPHC